MSLQSMPRAVLVLLLCWAATVHGVAQSESSDFAEAVQRFQEKNYFEALVQTRRLLRQDGDNPRYLHLHGLTLGALRQFSEAVIALRKATQLAPTEATYQHDLAMTLLQTGPQEEALDALQRSVELDPSDLLARLYLGRIYHNTNFSDLAMDQFQAIQRQDNRFPTLHYHMAKIFLNSGQAELALAELRTEVSHYPDNPLPRLELAEVLINTGEAADALVELQQAERTAEPQSRLYWLRGKALRQLGRTREALQAALRSVELNENFAAGHYLLSQLYREQGDAEKALDSLQRFETLAARQGSS